MNHLLRITLLLVFIFAAKQIALSQIDFEIKTAVNTNISLFPKSAVPQIPVQFVGKNNLQIKDYTILHKEFGVIPMSLAQFERAPSDHKRVINIGTAGGYTKASSGYTFQFIQKNTEQIIDRLEKNQVLMLQASFREKMFQWYDRTLIDVMLSKKMAGKEIFSLMFKKLTTDKILAFLANESTLLEDMKIMYSLPLKPFFTSGIKQLR